MAIKDSRQLKEVAEQRWESRPAGTMRHLDKITFPDPRNEPSWRSRTTS